MSRWIERACFALLLVYLAWIPLPFGSASDGVQTLLIVPPLLLCAMAISLRWFHPLVERHSRATRFWLVGGFLFTGAIALQLIPLPPAMLRALSPEAARIRASADSVLRLAGQTPSSMHPLTLDPSDTALQGLRVLAYVATFLTALLLVRGGRRRLALAVLLVIMSIFEAVYAIREASLQRFAIWGWKNRLMFGRASGTFVNPNHFAHYGAILLPFSAFLMALAWHEAAPPGAPVGRRVAGLVEKKIVQFGLGAAGVLACFTSIVIAQSRGALVAVFGGVALAALMTLSGQRGMARRLLLVGSVMAVVALGALVLTQSGLASRFSSGQVAAGMGGRQAPIRAAMLIWTRFPLMGSGANTFENVVLMVEDAGEVFYNHAHNDYAEIAATMGALGLMVGLVPLVAGFASLGKFLRRRSKQQRWRRRAFQGAALASIAIALTHALVDFNFFIPANPATLAAIAGAAAAASIRPRRAKPETATVPVLAAIVATNDPVENPSAPA